MPNTNRPREVPSGQYYAPRKKEYPVEQIQSQANNRRVLPAPRWGGDAPQERPWIDRLLMGRETPSTHYAEGLYGGFSPPDVVDKARHLLDTKPSDIKYAWENRGKEGAPIQRFVRDAFVRPHESPEQLLPGFPVTISTDNPRPPLTHTEKRTPETSILDALVAAKRAIERSANPSDALRIYNEIVGDIEMDAPNPFASGAWELYWLKRQAAQNSLRRWYNGVPDYNRHFHQKQENF